MDVIYGAASFDAHTLAVNDDTVTADNITHRDGHGARPHPHTGHRFAGRDGLDAVLSMTECPKSVVIIGGGVIGVEFATLFSRWA